MSSREMHEMLMREIAKVSVVAARIEERVSGVQEDVSELKKEAKAANEALATGLAANTQWAQDELAVRDAAHAKTRKRVNVLALATAFFGMLTLVVASAVFDGIPEVVGSIIQFVTHLGIGG